MIFPASDIVNLQHANVESLRNTSVTTITPPVPTEIAISTPELFLLPAIVSGEKVPQIIVRKEVSDKVIKLLLSTVKEPHLLATKVAGCIYTTADLVQYNHKKLDAIKLQYIEAVVFSKFPCSGYKDRVCVWKYICKKIDDKHRHLKRLDKRRSKHEL